MAFSGKKGIARRLCLVSLLVLARKMLMQVLFVFFESVEGGYWPHHIVMPLGGTTSCFRLGYGEEHCHRGFREVVLMARGSSRRVR